MYVKEGRRHTHTYTHTHTPYLVLRHEEEVVGLQVAVSDLAAVQVANACQDLP
jgi:hypothetical protein